MRKRSAQISGIMLAVVALAACQTITAESSEQASGPDTAKVVWIDTHDRSSRLDDQQVAWLPANSASDQIQFVCVHNQYLERQFALDIVDDTDGDIANPGCRSLMLPASSAVNPTASHAGDSHVLWLVTPYFAKIQRKAEYVFSQPNVIDKVAVHSRPITRMHVLAIDLHTGLCAEADLHATIRETEFDLEPDLVADANSVARSMRHGKEDFRLQLKLSEIHKNAGSILASKQPVNCDDVIDSLATSEGLHRLKFSLVSSPLRALESSYSPVQSLIPEMDSVVRIRVCKDADCDDYGLGSGFYIEDAGDGTSASDTSTLILTNYHVVEGAQGGMIRLSTLQHESVIGGLTEEGFGQLYHDYFPGVVVFHDERRDLALVRVSDMNSGTPLQLYGNDLALSDDLHVMALGHPKGATYYTTIGFISRIVMDCDLRSKSGRHFEKSPVKCIQHDAAIDQGSSGGPLLSAATGQERFALGVNVRVLAPSWAYIASVLNPKVTEQELQRIESLLPALPYPGRSTAVHYEEVQMFLNEFFESSASASDIQ